MKKIFNIYVIKIDISDWAVGICLTIHRIDVKDGGKVDFTRALFCRKIFWLTRNETNLLSVILRFRGKKG